MKRLGIIVGPEVGNEPEAIRQTAEYFGYQVVMKYLGRPNDFLQLLGGQDPLFNALDCWIFSVHGDDRKFILPELDPSIYQEHEPRHPIGIETLAGQIILNAQLILNTGCTLGNEPLAQLFISGGAQAYIGATDYVEGNAGLLFCIRFLYEWMKDIELASAFALATAVDQETGLFRLYHTS
ncbi:MAG: delta-aminolevulinic acid dehydratase [Saprospiraceae bacterium]|nr:delta-aminolevulinic acid dehydratase [Saprospiraceae bacterium]